MKRISLLIIVVASLATPATILADPAVSFGSEVPTSVFSIEGNVQLDPIVAIAPAGDKFVIAWIEESTVLDIFFEIRSTTNPSTVIGAGSIVSTASGLTDDEVLSGAAFSPDGTTLILAWGVGDDAGAAFQRIDGVTGALLGSRVDAPLGVNAPKVDFFSDGSFLLGYEGGEGIDGSGAFLQRYDSTGTPVGTTVTAASGTAGNQNDVAIAIRRTGNVATDTVVVAWEDNGTTRFADDDVNFRIFDSSLSPLTAQTPIPAANLIGVALKCGNPHVGVAANGDFAIGYETETSGNDEKARVSFLTSTGAAAQANSLEAIGSGARNQSVSVRYHAGTDSFAVFAGTRTADAPIKFFSRNGIPYAGSTNIASTETLDARKTSLAVVGDNAVAAWQDNDVDSAFFRFFTLKNSVAAGATSWDLYR